MVADGLVEFVDKLLVAMVIPSVIKVAMVTRMATGSLIQVCQ